MGGAFHTPPSTPRPSPVPRRSPNTAWEQHVWVAADAPHDVWVLELLENADLPNRRAWDALVLSLQSNLLERNELPRHAVARLVHHTIRALADLLDLLVLLHCEGAPRRPSRRRAEKRSLTGASTPREELLQGSLAELRRPSRGESERRNFARLDQSQVLTRGSLRRLDLLVKRARNVARESLVDDSAEAND